MLRIVENFAVAESLVTRIYTVEWGMCKFILHVSSCLVTVCLSCTVSEIFCVELKSAI